IDDRILAAWRVWPVNIAALELLEGRPASRRRVTAELESYLKEELDSLPRWVDRNAIRNNLLNIYATPARRKGL
ncbi:MAG: hypothetical protein IIU34_04325, partial [Bacteroidales bacterium]|nr:hypothetical protein [Bacteroidales bacterium]